MEENRDFFLIWFEWMSCAEHHTECSLKLPVTDLLKQHPLESKALGWVTQSSDIFFNSKLFLWSCWHLYDINKLLGMQNPYRKTGILLGLRWSESSIQNKQSMHSRSALKKKKKINKSSFLLICRIYLFSRQKINRL